MVPGRSATFRAQSVWPRGDQPKVAKPDDHERWATGACPGVVCLPFYLPRVAASRAILAASLRGINRCRGNPRWLPHVKQRLEPMEQSRADAPAEQVSSADWVDA